MRSGYITDDIIRNNLAALVPKGVRLYIVLDACHSGTGCDLRYKYDDSSYLTNKLTTLPAKYITTDWSLQQTSYEFKRYNKTTGEVFCISGCQDTQKSIDAYIEGQFTGALTHILLTCLRNNSLTTYKWKHLLKDVCCGEKVLRFTQRTAITSGNPLNLENTVFITPSSAPAPAPRPVPIKTSQSVINTGRRSTPTPTVSLCRILNYNPKINKLYIKYH